MKFHWFALSLIQTTCCFSFNFGNHHHSRHYTLQKSSSLYSSFSPIGKVSASSSPSEDKNVNGSNSNAINVSQRAQSVESFKVMDVLCRANELEFTHGRTIYHCEVGQPESGAPQAVVQEALNALTGPKRESVLGYTDAFGISELRTKIKEHYLQKYSFEKEKEGAGNTLPFDESQIVVTIGSSGGFLLTFNGCFDAGDTIAVASSGYPCYRNILSALDCKLASIPINSQFKLTAKELEKEIIRRKESGETKLKGLILSSPSNPTGAMLTPDELKELCELCDEEQIQFISDEIYHGITYGSVSEATALQFSEKVIVINSFSKYYSMSGWRLGWMVIPKELIDPINSLQQNMFISAPGISQRAALKCWDEESITELESHVQKYRTSRKIILDSISTIFREEQIAPADGGFYVYIDMGEENVNLDKGKGAVSFCKSFLEEEGVAFTPGVDFEDPETDLGEMRFRISYAGGINTAKEAMKAFHRFWPKWVNSVQEGE